MVWTCFPSSASCTLYKHKLNEINDKNESGVTNVSDQSQIRLLQMCLQKKRKKKWIYGIMM